MKDKYSAVWVSHTSINDFLRCPRAYFINNVYKDPKTGHKVKLMQPALSLGQAVHEVIESLSILPTEVRFKESLLAKYEKLWHKVSGKIGGFTDADMEARFKERGANMIRRVMQHPGLLKNKAVKINMDLPHYWLSEEDNIILCGKIDWLEYLQDTDTVHIVDFKTGKNEENPNSLQLAIYHLLVLNCQKRKATKASYWYIDQADTPKEVALPDVLEAREKILAIAKKIKLVRQLEHFKCSQEGGCTTCKPLEKILLGAAEFVGVNEYKQDVYILPLPNEEANTSTIL